MQKNILHQIIFQNVITIIIIITMKILKMVQNDKRF